MNPIKITRDMLPNLPDEIYELFIVPQNDAPLNIFDSQPEGRWYWHFGGLSLEEFKQLRWRRDELSFDKTIFHPDSYSDIDGLIKYCEANESQMSQARFQGYSPSSREFMPHLMLAMIEAGKFNAPIVGIHTNIGIRVLDGTHRLAASLVLKSKVEIPIDAWIGE